MYKDSAVRSGYILLGMLKTSYLRNALFAISRQFEKVKPDDLADDLLAIVKGSAEDNQSARARVATSPNTFAQWSATPNAIA